MLQVFEQSGFVLQVFEQSGEQTEGEGGGKESQAQSKAVHLLLTLLHRFPPLTVPFAHMQGYEMLAIVLRSSKTRANHSLVKVNAMVLLKLKCRQWCNIVNRKEWLSWCIQTRH